MRVTTKAIHELARLGHDVRVEKGDGYFYVRGKESTDWLDKTVPVPTLSSLTLEQWIAEFNPVRKLNAEPSGGNVKQEAPRKASKRK